MTLRIELEPPVSVSGTLVDRVNGRAIAGAITILMRQATSIVSSTAIAERGEFKFGDLPSGSALVISRADGYAPGVAAATLEPKVGGNSVRVGLLLEAQAAGTVVDSAGAPVAEAEVLIAYVNNPGAGVLESYAGGRFHTQADGEFALRALGPGHADRAPGSPRRPNVRRGPGDGGAGHDPKRDSADASVTRGFELRVRRRGPSGPARATHPGDRRSGRASPGGYRVAGSRRHRRVAVGHRVRQRELPAPLRPRAQAAWSPARVRSRISVTSPGNARPVTRSTIVLLTMAGGVLWMRRSEPPSRGGDAFPPPFVGDDKSWPPSGAATTPTPSSGVCVTKPANRLPTASG